MPLIKEGRSKAGSRSIRLIPPMYLTGEETDRVDQFIEDLFKKYEGREHKLNLELHHGNGNVLWEGGLNSDGQHQHMPTIESIKNFWKRWFEYQLSTQIPRSTHTDCFNDYLYEQEDDIEIAMNK